VSRDPRWGKPGQEQCHTLISGNCVIILRHERRGDKSGSGTPSAAASAVQETAKKVNSILDFEKLLDEIVGGVAEAFGCNRTAVLLKDDARNDFVDRFHSGFHSCGWVDASEKYEQAIYKLVETRHAESGNVQPLPESNSVPPAKVL
jgi:hypothetical protein